MARSPSPRGRPERVAQKRLVAEVRRACEALALLGERERHAVAGEMTAALVAEIAAALPRDGQGATGLRAAVVPRPEGSTIVVIGAPLELAEQLAKVLRPALARAREAVAQGGGDLRRVA